MDLEKNKHWLISDIRQRAIHIEDKINDLLVRVPSSNEFRGSLHQRYGHLTYSQHGEDLVFVALLERMRVERPTYLDIGCNHPTDCSNTALLYSRGARGVNIDASPDVIDLFKAARPDDVNINVGAAAAAGEMIFYRFGATSGRNTFSRDVAEQFIRQNAGAQISDTIPVRVMTLDQIIQTHCGGVCPDLLSLDVEGLDYDILASASFATRPRILCVETISAAGDDEARLDALLRTKGFRRVIQMFANGVYVDADARI
jgi:FkbM family methyltransferase